MLNRIPNTEVMTSLTTFFAFQHFEYHMYRWSMMKNIHNPNLVGIGSWGPEIWPLEYLISPIAISYPTVMNQANLHLISMGLIRYSCGHILGPHEPIHVKIGLWVCEGFWSCSTEIWSWKCWNTKKKISWRHTSVLFNVGLINFHTKF